MKSIPSLARFVTAISLTLPIASIAAQVVRSLPTHVEVADDGRWTVVTAPVDPVPIELLPDTAPLDVPVYQLDKDGAVSSGVTYSYTGDSPATGLRYSFPGPLVLQQDGSWRVWPMYWSRTCAPVMPGETVFMPGSIRSRLAIDDPDSPLGIRPLHTNLPQRAPLLVLDYDNEFAPQPDGVVVPAIQRAIGVWAEYLKNESFTAQVHVYWNTALISTGSLAFNERVYTEFTWTQVHGLLTAVFYPTSDQDPVETNLHQYLPIGADIPIENSLADTDIEMIQIDGLLLAKLGFPFTPAVVVGVNPTYSFDYDPVDGVPGIYDFTGTMVHELGHAAGFQAEARGYGAPPPAPLPSSIALLDVFRFSADDLPTISANEMQFGDRWFGVTLDPYIGMDINNASRVYQMTGPNDGYGPQHWAGFNINSSDYIGIMNPFSNVGPKNKGGSYLQLPDKRVFDIIGFDVDDGELLVSVPPIHPQTPALSAVLDATSIINLTWSSSPGATHYHAFVYDLDQGPEPVEVFSQRNVPAGTFATTIPANTLSPGRSFEWFISGDNAGGVAYSESWTFETEESCLADTNNDGILSPADFSAWIAAFNTQAPACDQNNDTLCTPSDFSAFIANYNAGC